MKATSEKRKEVSGVKVELLYYEESEGFPVARNLLEQVLQEEGLDEKVELIRITSRAEAEKYRFPGSPTIRINGADVDPSYRPAGDYGFRIRLYSYDGRLHPYPSAEMIREAIRRNGRLPQR